MSQIINYGISPPVMECTVCGATEAFTLPMSIDRMHHVIDDFRRTHHSCMIKKLDAEVAQLKKAF